MSNKGYILIFALIIGFVSCKKEEFPLESSNSIGAVFKTVGTIDGEDVSFGAGENGYVLDTDYKETYDGNFILTANFHPSDCSDCGSELKISLETNTGIHHGNTFDETLITNSDLPFYRSSLDEVHHVVNMSNILIESQINSTVVNGYIAQNNVLPLGINETIVLDYVYSENTSNINNDHYFEFGNACDSPEIQNIDIFGVAVNDITNVMTISRPDFGITGVYTYLIAWEADGSVMDEQINSSEDIITFSLDPDVNFYNVTLVFNADNEDLYIQRQNHISPILFLNIPIISMEVLNVEQIPTPLMQIEYTDENGEMYISRYTCASQFHQNIENIFQVSHVEDYKDNALGAGSKTKLIEFSTSCELVNHNNADDVISMDSFSGTFALTLPE